MSDDSRVARATDPPRFIVSSVTGYSDGGAPKLSTIWFVNDRFYNYRVVASSRWIRGGSSYICRIAQELNDAWEETQR